jgi:hypothetical protein
MRFRSHACLAALLAPAIVLAPAASFAQVVVDRTIARVEGDVVLLSELRELGQFQQLVEGRPQPDDKRFNELIDQWIIEHEAQTAGFSLPTDAEVASSRQKLIQEIGGDAQFHSRATSIGISDPAIDRQIRRALFFSRYVDYKFRPAAQVENDAIDKYYKDEFVPRLQSSSQTVPPLDSVRDQIRELLVQREISARSEQWLADSRSHLKIENLFNAPPKPEGPHS